MQVGQLQNRMPTIPKKYNQDISIFNSNNSISNGKLHCCPYPSKLSQQFNQFQVKQTKITILLLTMRITNEQLQQVAIPYTM